MEAPQPPSGMNYNEFRTWRKEQGITGTRQDLSDAWLEYKPNNVSRSSKTSPRSSPRSSPRRSPRRYGGFSSASLVGLPLDVGRIMSSHLTPATVAVMRKA